MSAILIGILSRPEVIGGAVALLINFLIKIAPVKYDGVIEIAGDLLKKAAGVLTAPANTGTQAPAQPPASAVINPSVK